MCPLKLKVAESQETLSYCSDMYYVIHNWVAPSLFISTVITLFDIFIFCPKVQLWFPEKIVDFLLGEKLVKMLWLKDSLAVNNFDFTRKIVKNFGEKLVKMLGVCRNWIFGQKFDFSNSVPEEHFQIFPCSVGTLADTSKGVRRRWKGLSNLA